MMKNLQLAEVHNLISFLGTHMDKNQFAPPIIASLAPKTGFEVRRHEQC